MITLDQLRAVRAIADHRSIGAAARHLRLSQPTLSHHLAALEAVVGGPLVERSPRGSTLTPLGEIAAVHADAIIRRPEVAEQELRVAARGEISIAVGSFPSAAAALLVPAVASLTHGTNPYAITILEQPELFPKLIDRSLQIALLASDATVDPALPDEIAIRSILDDPLVALLPPNHRLATRTAIELTELADDSWIIAASSDDSIHDALARALRVHAIPLHVVHRVDDYAVTEALVAANFGVALVPSLALGQLTGQAIARPLAEPSIMRRIHVAWHERPSSPHITQLVHAIEDIATRIRGRAVPFPSE